MLKNKNIYSNIHIYYYLILSLGNDNHDTMKKSNLLMSTHTAWLGLVFPTYTMKCCRHTEPVKITDIFRNEHIYMHALVIITLVSCPSETNTHKKASFLFHSFSQKLFFTGNQSLPGGSTLIVNMQLNTN